MSAVGRNEHISILTNERTVWLTSDKSHASKRTHRSPPGRGGVRVPGKLAIIQLCRN